MSGKNCCSALTRIFTFVLCLWLHTEVRAQEGKVESGGATGGSKELKDFDWVDTTSPRTTLASLLTGAQRYHGLIRERGFARENKKELGNIAEQARRLFDLRDFPPGSRREVAVETLVFVREVLARVGVPDMAQVFDEDEMSERIQKEKVAAFRVPNTPFEIMRIEEGPEAGHYQFSGSTVRNAESFFTEIRHLPYLTSERSSVDFYSAYFFSPGPHVPDALINSLPPWMLLETQQHPLWKWIMMALFTLLGLALLVSVYVIVPKMSRRSNDLNRNLLMLLRPVFTILIVISLDYIMKHEVRITGNIFKMGDFVRHFVILAASVTITLRLGNVLAEVIVDTTRFWKHHIDKQFVRLLLRLGSVAIASMIAIEEMQQMGFSLTTLVAGAGVSGLALALAAQGTLKNIFAGIELSLDKPFVAGQRIRIKDYEGDVEELGLRSTKIRILNGHLVTIANEEVARLDIENIGRRNFIRRDFNVTVSFSTPPKKVSRAIEIIKEILSVPGDQECQDTPDGRSGSSASDAAKSRPHRNEAINKPDHLPRVFFSEMNADSLNILVIYFYGPPNYWAYMGHVTWVNFQILERLSEEGIEFAFPTQTLHVASLPATSGHETERPD